MSGRAGQDPLQSLGFLLGSYTQSCQESISLLREVKQRIEADNRESSRVNAASAAVIQDLKLLIEGLESSQAARHATLVSSLDAMRLAVEKKKTTAWSVLYRSADTQLVSLLIGGVLGSTLIGAPTRFIPLIMQWLKLGGG